MGEISRQMALLSARAVDVVSADGLREKLRLAIAENSVAAGLAGVQEKASFLPDYGFKDAPPELATIGTGVAGVTGAALTLAMVTLLGLMIKRRLRAART